MEHIVAPPPSRASWEPSAVPAVDDVRPPRCGACRQPARVGERINLHGHGVRARGVVVLARTAEGAARVVEHWARRYRCVLCGAVTTVLPRGTMRRFLYSVGAIVMAFFLVTSPPVGDGLGDEAAYTRQGMYAKTAWRDADPYRWRSLERWSAAVARWWPGSASVERQALLVSFVERAGEGGREAALEAAVDAHAGWGRAM